MNISQQQSAPTLEDVWRLFAETSQQMKMQSAETDRKFQETDRKFQETDREFQEIRRLFQETAQENKRLFQETAQENKRLFQETAQENKRRSEETAQENKRRSEETAQENKRRSEEIAQENKRRSEEIAQENKCRSEETDRFFKARAEETDRLFKARADETDRFFKTQSRETKRLEELFTSQWGKLMESLVEGDVVAIFNRFGINVLDTSTRVKGHTPTGQQFEFDIIAHNGESTVIIEVKTTLRPEYVKNFVKKLDSIKTWLPRYANNTLYGAMAFLTADAGSEVMAENLGLIVIRATGNSASIINKEAFNPRKW